MINNMFFILSTILIALQLIVDIPQIYKLIKTKSSQDLSLGTYSITFTMSILYTILSTKPFNGTLFLVSLINCLTLGIVIFLTLKYCND